MMKFVRQLARFSLALAGALVFAGGAQAQSDYPNKPIKFVVPYAPGGLPDTIARVLGQRFTESMGHQVVVENRPSAGGIVGCEAVAKAAPDGYTLLVADVGQLAINPALYSKLPYDSVKDFAPVSQIGTSALFLAAHSSVPVNSLADLIKLAKAKPGQLNYGSSGTGSIHHLSMEALKEPLGVDIVHVPYKGTGQSIPALIGGQVSLAYSALPSLVAHIKSGGIKLLAASTAKRSTQMPDVPTVAEITGIKDYDYAAEIGMLAPAGTPKAIVDKLSAEVKKAVKNPDTIQRYNALAIDIVGSTPEEYVAIIRDGIKKYAKVVKASGAKLD